MQSRVSRYLSLLKEMERSKEENPPEELDRLWWEMNDDERRQVEEVLSR